MIFLTVDGGFIIIEYTMFMSFVNIPPEFFVAQTEIVDVS